MMGLSVGSGILGSVVFLVLIGLSIFTLILWKDQVEGVGETFSTFAFTTLTVAVAFFLAFVLGLV